MSYQVRKRKHNLLFAAAGLLLAIVCYAGTRPAAGILWLDFDMKNIPEPKARPNSYYDYFWKGQVVEEAKRKVDVPHWVRRASGHPKQAANVNALDEVPDSSWYTNRHYLHPMTIEELVRGPDRGDPPDFKQATVIKAKTVGVSPGFWLKDAKGHDYVIKLDDSHWPGNESSAEIIATKIFYASGYNVPENYLAYIDASELQIKKDLKIEDETGTKRPFTHEDLDKILRHAARMPDGRYRAVASKVLPGKPKGPFSHVGLREDDPNDLIPHEHRRELRGLRVVASWIGNWDMKEGQSLDTYVEENGRKFLRHYILDFNSALGADTDPTEYYHGHEYGFDLHSLAKEIVTLGIYTPPDEKQPPLISPEVGLFSSRDFKPAGWKQTFPSVMFDNLTDQDAFWATRIVLSFSEQEIRAIVASGHYIDPADTDYIVKTLLERQEILAAYWLRKVDGLSQFSVQPDKDGLALEFHDLMLDHKLAPAGSTQYTYEIKGPHYRSGKKNTREQRIAIDRATLGAALENGTAGGPIAVTIWTNREKSVSPPVTVEFTWDGSRGILSALKRT
jgi:hypothetical protein